MNRKPVLLLAMLLLTFTAGDLLAAAKGGKRRRHSADDPADDKDNWGMSWYDTVGEATHWAEKGQKPVLVVITRDGNESDHKLVERLASWPQAVELSKQHEFGPVEVYANQDDGEALVKKMNLKTLPAAVWLDHHGNAISGAALPDNAGFLTTTIANWKTTLANIDKYYKDHLGRGDHWLLRGKLREAYVEYSLVAPFKGPEGDKAREGQNAVKEQWLKLANLAAQTPAGLSRDAILKGVRREAVGLDFAPTLEKEIAKALAQSAAPKAPATPAQVADKKADGKAVADTSKPAAPEAPKTVAASTPPPPSAGLAGPPPPAALESKGLAQLSTASASSLGVSVNERDVEDTSVDTKGLAARTDDRFKKADTLIQEATASYKKALDEKMPRGPERNALLKDAHNKFESAINLLDAATGSKPDAGIEKMMEKISMMMYGCLKYQSL